MTGSVDSQQAVGEIALRLDRLPISRFHVLTLVIASLSLLFDTLDTVVTGFVLTAIRPEWGFGVEWIGIISATGLAGYWLGSLSSGFVGDRIGRKRVILYTLIAYSAFSFSRGFASEEYGLLLLNFLTWTFVGAESSIVPVYLAEMWPSEKRARLSGWMMSFFAMGLAASPLWAVAIIPNLGWRWAFFLTAPLALLFGFARRYLIESPRWLARTGQADRARDAMDEIETRAGYPGGAGLPAPEQRPAGLAVESNLATVRDLLAPGFRARSIMLWIAWFAQYGVLYAFLTFVPTLLTLDGLTVTRSLAYSVVIYSAYVPAYILGGYLSDLLDRKWLIVLAFAGTALFGTLFALSTTTAAVLIFGGLSAFSAGLGATGVYTYTPELYPTEIRATAMGVASSFGRIGSIALLLVFGIFAVLQGKLFLFLIADAVLLAGILAVALLGPRTRGRLLEVTARSA